MASKKRSKKKFIIGAVLGSVYIVMRISARRKVLTEDIDTDNPYLDKQERGSSSGRTGVYVQAIKPAIDRMLSFGGLLLLAPIFAVISMALYLDDPGPVLFTQKRVGKDKRFFELHKFRSMKMSTPHDVPTHQLLNPEQYITKVGAFLRKTSLDELPQIWDIFKGDMSIIGPRPALWNHEDLVTERQKNRANDLKPGLT